MNDETQDLLQQLERATAPETKLLADANEETALLRQSWLSLTRLLQAADAPWDESAFRPQTLSSARQRRWTRLATVAIAASLLVAATALWLLRNLPNSLQPNRHEVVSVQNQHSSEQNATEDGSVLLAPASDELAWDDTLDEQLSKANRALLSLRHGRHRDEATLDVLQDQLQSIQQEMETRSL